MHQSLSWFLSLNWRKFTSYRSLVLLPLVIATSQWPIVPMGFYRCITLRSASLGDRDNLRRHELFGRWLHNFAYRGRIIHCSLRHIGTPSNFYTFWVICLLFNLLLIFEPSCFITGHLRGRELFGKWREDKLSMAKSHGANNGLDQIAAAVGKPELHVSQLICISW